MTRRLAVIAVGVALVALPGTAFGAASEKANCLAQAASDNSGPKGSKGAFVSQVATQADRGFSTLAVRGAQCEDRG